MNSYDVKFRKRTIDRESGYTPPYGPKFLRLCSWLLLLTMFLQLRCPNIVLEILAEQKPDLELAPIKGLLLWLAAREPPRSGFVHFILSVSLKVGGIMQQMAESIIKHYYGITPKKIKFLGGGFYGRVFFAELSKEPFDVVIKIYLYPYLAEKESCQLNILSAHSTVKIPKVYFLHNANNNIPNDAIVMEYISGINAGDSNVILTETNRKNIAESIIDNLLSYHNTVNPNGFGEIGADDFEPDWKEYYKPKVIAALHKAEYFYSDNKIDDCTFSIIKRACKMYDKIFYLPIKEACLIHGDYNTWNILLDENLTHVKAVIDPFNCCWADSELDLYQLLNANGNSYRLLDIYASKCQLTENFSLKLPFYVLISEINHFYDAKVDVNVDYCMISPGAQELDRQMKNFGLC